MAESPENWNIAFPEEAWHTSQLWIRAEARPAPSLTFLKGNLSHWQSTLEEVVRVQYGIHAYMHASYVYSYMYMYIYMYMYMHMYMYMYMHMYMFLCISVSIRTLTNKSYTSSCHVICSVSLQVQWKLHAFFQTHGFRAD